MGTTLSTLKVACTFGMGCGGLAATVVGGADVVAVVIGVVMATFDTIGVVDVKTLVSKVVEDTGRFCIPKNPWPSRDSPALTGVILRVVAAASGGGS